MSVYAEPRFRVVRALRLWRDGFRLPTAWRESRERVVLPTD